MSSCSIHEDAEKASLGAGLWAQQAYDWLIATWIHDNCAEKRLRLIEAGYPGSPDDLFHLDSSTYVIMDKLMNKKGFNLYLIHRTRLALIEKVVAKQTLIKALHSTILVSDCFGTRITRGSQARIQIARFMYEEKEKNYIHHLDRLNQEKTQLNPSPKRSRFSFCSRTWKYLTRVRTSFARSLRSRQSNHRAPSLE